MKGGNRADSKRASSGSEDLGRVSGRCPYGRAAHAGPGCPRAARAPAASSALPARVAAWCRQLGERPIAGSAERGLGMPSECPRAAGPAATRGSEASRAGSTPRPGGAAGPGCTDGLLLTGSKLRFSSLRGFGYSVTAAHLSAHNKQNAHCYCCRCCTP